MQHSASPNPWKWLILTLVSSGCASTPALMADGPPVGPPPGLVSFCTAHKDACQVAAEASGSEPVGPNERVELDRVNMAVNQSITARPDGLSGDVETWSLPLEAPGPVSGDCEDFALEKQHLLITRGWPRSQLRLAVAVHPKLGTHAVLIATTRDGDFVLDNLRSKVRRWDQTGYVFLARQSADNDLIWHKVQ